MNSTRTTTTRRPRSQFAQDLQKELAKPDPDPEICRTLLSHECSGGDGDESKDPDLIVLSILTASQKTFRLRRRKSPQGSKQHEQWDELLRLVQTVLDNRRNKSKNKNSTQPPDASEQQQQQHEPPHDDEQQPGHLPTTASQYLARLKKHQKDLYKNPPVLPPAAVTIYETRAPLPSRDPKSGRLVFAATREADAATAQLIQESFHPNTTPPEILRAGAFGGTYFRPLHSAVTNTCYKSRQVLQDTVDADWIAGLDQRTYLINTKYNAAVNKFGVPCGGSLGMWESSGWISDADPYGWFQWYCRFYRGRRSSDDARQIKRWLGVAGPKGRFKSQLCNKILAAGGRSRVDDASISPVIRQSLLHWGLRITGEILQQHKKK